MKYQWAWLRIVGLSMLLGGLLVGCGDPPQAEQPTPIEIDACVENSCADHEICVETSGQASCVCPPEKIRDARGICVDAAGTACDPNPCQQEG